MSHRIVEYASRRRRLSRKMGRTDPLAVVPFVMTSVACLLLGVNIVAAWLPRVDSRGGPVLSWALLAVVVIVQLSAVACAVIALAASTSRRLARWGALVSVVGVMFLVLWVLHVLRF